MTDRTFEINKNLMCFLLVLVILCTVFMPVQGVAFAVEESGSNVLVDLNKAENFNVDDYPYNPTDNSLHVIHVAESTDKELLVYVYQPSGEAGDIRASSITFSVLVDEEFSPDMKKLEFLNSSGVFYKYKVKDFVVSDAKTRVYSFISIFRPYIEGIDEEVGFDNTVSEVPFKVAKEYTFHTGEDGYLMEVLDVIEITDKFVGYVTTSSENVLLATDSLFGFTQSWHIVGQSQFVAFSTDLDIDKLYEVEIYYESQNCGYRYEYSLINPVDEYVFQEPSEEEVVISSEDRLSYTSGALWWAEDKTVNRIQTGEEFVNSFDGKSLIYSSSVLDASFGEVLTDDAKLALSNKDWVVRFADTEFWTTSDINGNYFYESGVRLSDVSILRIKCLSGDDVYNLGVVDNKQTGSLSPVGGFEYDVDFKLPSWLDGLKSWLDGLKDIAKLILLIVFIILMLPVVYYVLKFIVWVFKSIAKAIKRSSKKREQKKKNK